MKRKLRAVLTLSSMWVCSSVFAASVTIVDPESGGHHGYATDTGWRWYVTDMMVGYQDNPVVNNVQARGFVWFSIPSDVVNGTVNSATLTVTVESSPTWNSLLYGVDLYDMGSMTVDDFNALSSMTAMYNALVGVNWQDYKTQNTTLTFNITYGALFNRQSSVGFSLRAYPEIPSGIFGDQSNYIYVKTPTLVINYTPPQSTTTYRSSTTSYQTTTYRSSTTTYRSSTTTYNTTYQSSTTTYNTTYRSSTTTYNSPWDAGYQDLGGGWRRLSWFGDYIPMGGAGWIWHNKHGFFYVPPSSTPQSIYFYAQDMGWLWTSNTTYPYLYRFSDGAWLWYNGATGPRWFLNMNTSHWESW